MSFMPAPRSVSYQNLPIQRPVSQGNIPRQILSPQAVRGNHFTFQQPHIYSPSSKGPSRPVSAQGTPFSTQQNFYPKQRNSFNATQTQFYNKVSHQQQLQPQQIRQQPQLVQQKKFNLTSGQYQPQRFVFQQPSQMLSPQRAAPQISTIRQPDAKQLQIQQQQQQQQARQRNLRANLSPSPLKTPAINFQPRNQKAPKQVLVPASLANVRTPQKQVQYNQNSEQNANNGVQQNQTQNGTQQQQQQQQKQLQSSLQEVKPQLQKVVSNQSFRENSGQKKQFIPVVAQVEDRGSFRAPRIYTTSAQKPQQRSISQQSSGQKPVQIQNNIIQQQMFRSPSNAKLSQPITAKNQANYFQQIGFQQQQQQQQQKVISSRVSSSNGFQQVSPVKISRVHSPSVKVLNGNPVLQNQNTSNNLVNNGQLTRSKAPQHLLNMETGQENKPSVLDTVTNQFTNFLDNLL